MHPRVIGEPEHLALQAQSVDCLQRVRPRRSVRGERSLIGQVEVLQLCRAPGERDLDPSAVATEQRGTFLVELSLDLSEVALGSCQLIGHALKVLADQLLADARPPFAASERCDRWNG